MGLEPMIDVTMRFRADFSIFKMAAIFENTLSELQSVPRQGFNALKVWRENEGDWMIKDQK